MINILYSHLKNKLQLVEEVENEIREDPVTSKNVNQNGKN